MDHTHGFPTVQIGVPQVPNRGLQPVKPSPIQIVAAVVLGQKVEQLDIMPPQIPLPGDSHATLKIRWDRTCRDFANAIMLLRFAFCVI